MCGRDIMLWAELFCWRSGVGKKPRRKQTAFGQLSYSDAHSKRRGTDGFHQGFCWRNRWHVRGPVGRLSRAARPDKGKGGARWNREADIVKGHEGVGPSPAVLVSQGAGLEGGGKSSRRGGVGALTGVAVYTGRLGRGPLQGGPLQAPPAKGSTKSFLGKEFVGKAFCIQAACAKAGEQACES